MRRLVVLDDAPIVGGAELFALKLARWLAEDRASDWRAVVACPAESAFAARCCAAGVAVEPVDYPPFEPAATPSMPGAIARLARVLRGTRDDGALVVANTARAQAYASVARLLVRHAPPVVNLVHEQETAARRSAQVVLRRVGRVVAVGANNAAVYERALPGVTVGRLNNVLTPAELHAAVAARRAASPPGAPVVGVLARMIREKGLLELVDELAAHRDAWSELRVAAPPQDAAYTYSVRARIDQLGLASRVELLGHVDDVAGFLGAIDVLVVPSTGNEGQPTAILEALAAGLPVVVRRHVWSTDFAGLAVTPYDSPDELAAALAANREPASAAELERRFGAEQALQALVVAEQRRHA